LAAPLVYIFDLDGTLVESVDAHIGAWIEALELIGVKKRREELAPLMGLPALEIARRIAPQRAEELARIKNKLFLEKYLGAVRAYDDAAVLARLPRPIAVVTSSSGYVAREILKATGLAEYVDLVVGGDEVPQGKPAPDPLYLVARRFGVPPSEMVVVGDSEYDIEMAKNAGALGVCIARRGAPCRGAHRVISTLFQLLGI